MSEAEVIRPIEGAVDFGKTAGDYARHRAGFPPVLFERLAALGVGLQHREVRFRVDAADAGAQLRMQLFVS